MSELNEPVEGAPGAEPSPAAEPAAEPERTDVEGVPDDGGVTDEVEIPETTGDPRVDEALARLRGLQGAPVAEHVAVYDDVNQRLQAALADLDGER